MTKKLIRFWNVSQQNGTVLILTVRPGESLSIWRNSYRKEKVESCPQQRCYNWLSTFFWKCWNMSDFIRGWKIHNSVILPEILKKALYCNVIVIHVWYLSAHSLICAILFWHPASLIHCSIPCHKPDYYFHILTLFFNSVFPQLFERLWSHLD